MDEQAALHAARTFPKFFSLQRDQADAEKKNYSNLTHGGGTMAKPAARKGDLHSCPKVEHLKAHDGGPIVEGSPDVFIGGQPAARVGDRVQCNGANDFIIEGEPSVLINGKPAARLGDKTAHGGIIISGCATVLIGTSAQGRCAQQAAANGDALLVVEG